MNKIHEKKIPICVGIIMDGNRRWAKAKGLLTSDGHNAGYKKLQELAVWATEAGIRHVILYAMSTENWNRKKEEIDAVTDIFRTAFKKELDKITRDGIRIKFIGQRERFTADLQALMENAEKETAHNTVCNFIIALSYGGRAEILNATEKLLKEGKTSISEADFEKNLWTAGIPDPDMIIRPGGEKRLSGFLTWQSVYSELFFTDTLWPDFSKQEFEKMLAEFNERERRHGK